MDVVETSQKKQEENSKGKMAKIKVLGGTIVPMIGHSRQKRAGDRLGKPENAGRRARGYSIRGYDMPPSGKPVREAQRALSTAAHNAAGVDGPKDYDKFMDEMVPNIPTGYEKYVGDGEFECRRKAQLARTAKRLALPA